jgi:hypothetical protein
MYFYCYVHVFLLCVYVSSPCPLAHFGYTEVFPCSLLSCKANARVKPAKTGHGPHSSKLFVLFYVFLFSVVLRNVCVCVCKCVLYYCHRVATQLQLTNISYHITLHQYLYDLAVTYLVKKSTIFMQFECSPVTAFPDPVQPSPHLHP